MAYCLDLFILFAVLITECLCGEICDFYSGSTKKFMYCGVSCCGSIYDRKCCEETPIGLYIGIIAGTIVCIILIIIIVICCVYQGKQKTTIRRHRTHQGGPDRDDFNMMRVLRAPPKPPEYTQDAPPAYDAQFSPFSFPEQNYANPPPPSTTLSPHPPPQPAVNPPPQPPAHTGINNAGFEPDQTT